MKKKDKKNSLFQIVKEDLEDLEKYVEEFSLFLPLAFTTCNPLGVIVNVNKAFQNLTEYKETEAAGIKAEELFADKESFEDLEEEVLKKGEILSREMKLLTKNKKEIPVSISLSTRQDEENNTIGYFLAISDIGELKALQQDLEKKVKERTKQLQGRVEELEKFKKLAEGRELRMVELKQEIKELKEELEKYKGR